MKCFCPVLAVCEQKCHVVEGERSDDAAFVGSFVACVALVPRRSDIAFSQAKAQITLVLAKIVEGTTSRGGRLHAIVGHTILGQAYVKETVGYMDVRTMRLRGLPLMEVRQHQYPPAQRHVRSKAYRL